MNGNRAGVVRNQTVDGMISRGDGVGRVLGVVVVRGGEVLAMDRLARQTDVPEEHDHGSGAKASANREPGRDATDRGSHDW
jgi:hypothetical protein